MELEEANNIMNDFGATIIEVSQKTMSHYPTLKYPQSLLPHDKETIRTALDICLKEVEEQQEDNIAEHIKVARELLNGFVEDKEAKEANDKLLSIMSRTKHRSENNNEVD